MMETERQEGDLVQESGLSQGAHRSFDRKLRWASTLRFHMKNRTLLILPGRTHATVFSAHSVK